MSRLLLFLAALCAIAASFFVLGVFQAQSGEALDRELMEARFSAMRAELRSRGGQRPSAGPAPTGTTGGPTWPVGADPGLRAGIVEDVKRQLQSEMGLLPVQLLRERRSSFVELYSEDSLGKSNYGTAGYLGLGYFLTVKHAVVALPDAGRGETRRVTSINVLYQGTEVPATIVDAGDAMTEVHSGDWAVIRTRPLDLPALRPNTAFAFEFAEPIFRLGNDYSKGIIVSTGYIGQRMSNGLVSALADGHPGVSGGGVLDRAGDLVGIPIGRMQGDYRFSFILPLRPEMLRRVPRTAAAPVRSTTGRGYGLP
jgi:S1-C subfamily serine protease